MLKGGNGRIDRFVDELGKLFQEIQETHHILGQESHLLWESFCTFLHVRCVTMQDSGLQTGRSRWLARGRGIEGLWFGLDILWKQRLCVLAKEAKHHKESFTQPVRRREEANGRPELASRVLKLPKFFVESVDLPVHEARLARPL